MSAAPGAQTDVAVIGGGLMGLAIATEAARRGMAVTVFEAESVGRHAASASAGGVRSLNRHPAEIVLARAALDDWAQLAARLGADCGFVRSGQIRVAEDESALAALERRAGTVRALGHDHEEMVGPDALRCLEPGLARHCLGALVVRDDGFADPLRTVHAYRKAARRLGVRISEGTPVRAVTRGPTLHVAHGDVRAGAVVNAAGAWGGAIATGVGERVPIEASALQMLVTAPVPPLVTAVIGSEGRKLSLKQGAAGHVVIGGGHRGTLTGRRSHPRPAAVAESLATAVRLFPALAMARLARSWAGIEGMVADDLPVIGPSRTVSGLFHVFGFSGHGFALAPLIARRVADTLAGDAPDPSLGAFGIGRFAAPGVPQTAPPQEAAETNRNGTDRRVRG